MHKTNRLIQRPLLKWLSCTLIIVVLDQFSKYLASSLLPLHESMTLIPFLNLTLAHNTGAAFSFLSSASGWQRWFFVVLAITVSVVIVVMLKRLPATEQRQALALSLILGGALGNVWDRIQLGYVIDFIDVYYAEWHWPVFNVADSAITVGAALLVYDMFASHRHDH